MAEVKLKIQQQCYVRTFDITKQQNPLMIWAMIMSLNQSATEIAWGPYVLFYLLMGISK